MDKERPVTINNKIDCFMKGDSFSTEYNQIFCEMISELDKKRHLLLFGAAAEIMENEFFSARSLKKKSLYFDREAATIVQSSGTSGSRSEISLTIEEKLIQAKVLRKIIYDFLKPEKNYDVVILVGEKGVAEDRRKYTSKQVALKGFSGLANKAVWLDVSSLNKAEGIAPFLIKYQNPVLVGFTSDIWGLREYFHNIDCKYTVIHGGGWKKLHGIGVNNREFESYFKNKSSSIMVVNYYGLIEQLGTVFLRCKEGVYHNSIFGQAIAVDENGHIVSQPDPSREYLIGLLSVLPRNGLTHRLLTEDTGRFRQAVCGCGRVTPGFEYGDRVVGSFIKGCSNI